MDKLAVISAQLSACVPSFLKLRLDQPPDGGYGWVATFACWLAFFAALGVESVFGVFFTSFLEDKALGAGRAELSWVQSIATFMELFLGILVGWLTRRFGARIVVILGGISLGLGLIFSSAATSVAVLYFTYSGLVGLGMALSYGAASIAVGQYFTSKRAFANGIAATGSGAGTMVLSKLIGYMVSYTSWRDCMRLVGVVGCAMIIVAGALLVPVGSAPSPSPTPSPTPKEGQRVPALGLKHGSTNSSKLSLHSKSNSGSKDGDDPTPNAGAGHAATFSGGAGMVQPGHTPPAAGADPYLTSPPAAGAGTAAGTSLAIRAPGSTSVSSSSSSAAAASRRRGSSGIQHTVSEFAVAVETPYDGGAEEEDEEEEVSPTSPMNKLANASGKSLSSVRSSGNVNNNSMTLKGLRAGTTEAFTPLALGETAGGPTPRGVSAPPSAGAPGSSRRVRVANMRERGESAGAAGRDTAIIVEDAAGGAGTGLGSAGRVTPRITQRQHEVSRSILLQTLHHGAGSFLHLPVEVLRLGRKPGARGRTGSTSGAITPGLPPTTPYTGRAASVVSSRAGGLPAGASPALSAYGGRAGTGGAARASPALGGRTPGGATAGASPALSGAGRGIVREDEKLPLERLSLGPAAAAASPAPAGSVAAAEGDVSIMSPIGEEGGPSKEPTPNDGTTGEGDAYAVAGRSHTAAGGAIAEVSEHEPEGEHGHDDQHGQEVDHDHDNEHEHEEDEHKGDSSAVLHSPQFWGIATAMALIVGGQTMWSIHIGAAAEQDAGLSRDFVSTMYFIVGLSGVIGRIITAVITLRYELDLLFLLQLYAAACGLAMAGLALYGDNAGYLLFDAIITGALGGSCFALVPPVLATTFGIEGLPFALGGTFTVRAPVVLLSGPVAGWVRTGTGRYSDVWLVAGFATIVSALPIGLMRCQCKRRGKGST